MKNKIIFELKINTKDRIIAYEKDDYDTCYEDSMLYFHTGSKRKKIIESSFCYGFGAEMYYRVHNIYNFCSSEDYIKQLKEFLDNQTYDLQEKINYNNPENHSYFAGCSVLADFDLYLIKIEEVYTLLLVKISEVELTGKYNVEVLNQYQISDRMFNEWKTLICNELEKRSVIEGEKIAQANSRGESTKEEWNQYFLSMRTDKKQD